MFDDYSMPLYELCERLKLERIDAEIYRNYINHVALETYGEILDSEVIKTIFSISERHPKRIYNLCHQLWITHPNASFSKENVHDCWDTIVKLRLNDVRVKLSKLNDSQLKVLTLIALDFDKPITGRKSQNKIDLSDEDFIARDENNELTIVDPLFIGRGYFR